MNKEKLLNNAVAATGASRADLESVMDALADALEVDYAEFMAKQSDPYGCEPDPELEAEHQELAAFVAADKESR